MIFIHTLIITITTEHYMTLSYFTYTWSSAW